MHNAQCTMQNAGCDVRGGGARQPLDPDQRLNTRIRAAIDRIRTNERGEQLSLLHCALCIVHYSVSSYACPSGCVHPGSSVKNISPVHPSSRIPISDE